ncbi:MAG: hypothetical protein JWR38_3073 [Mucilaginibacter sp.]|nr:hypothetical protein [Mucilaginibacter sp.]
MCLLLLLNLSFFHNPGINYIFIAYAISSSFKKDQANTAYRCYFLYRFGRSVRVGAFAKLCGRSWRVVIAPDNPFALGCTSHIYGA